MSHILRSRLLISAIFLLPFIALTTTSITYMGLHFEEASFALHAIDLIDPEMSLRQFPKVFSLPMFTNTYLGNGKTILYALYLQATGSTFSLVSWRLLTVLLSASGMAAFAYITRKTLSKAALSIFLLLCTTDISILLWTRYDHGPVIFSFFLRLIILGILVSRWNACRYRDIAMLSFLIGLSVYDKLNNVVLLLPLGILILLLKQKLHFWKQIGVSAAAGMTGGFFLIAKNIDTFIAKGKFFSLNQSEYLDRLNVLVFSRMFLELGSGKAVFNKIYSKLALVSHYKLEVLVMAFAIAVSCMIVVRARARTSEQLGMFLLASSALMLLAMYFLPGALPIRFYHVFAVVPFPYLAIALLFGSVYKHRTSYPIQETILCLASVVMLFSIRTSSLVQAYSHIVTHPTHITNSLYSPSINRIAEFATNNPHAVYFANTHALGNTSALYSNDNVRIKRLRSYQTAKLDQFLSKWFTKKSSTEFFFFVESKKIGVIQNIVLPAMESIDDWEVAPLPKELHRLSMYHVAYFKKVSN